MMETMPVSRRRETVMLSNARALTAGSGSMATQRLFTLNVFHQSLYKQDSEHLRSEHQTQTFCGESLKAHRKTADSHAYTSKTCIYTAVWPFLQKVSRLGWKQTSSIQILSWSSCACSKHRCDLKSTSAPHSAWNYNWFPINTQSHTLT